MDENKLELTLGLPGDNINWITKKCSVREREKESLLSLGYFNNNGGGVIGCGKEHNNHPWVSTQTTTSFSRSILHNGTDQKGLAVMGKESSQPCSTRIVDLQSAEKKKAFSSSSTVINTAVIHTNTSQKRAAPAAVVGWPPIRAFRKNLASTSTGKTVSDPQSAIPSKPDNEANGKKGQFVKVNMDGVPIGRKVDLSAYNNYDTLTSAVDQLFRGLLAAQSDSSAGAKDNKEEEQKLITGLLDGSGEYTLVYEDTEGDRMLAGDVPWHMFVSTVKRLRVLKSSDLPNLKRGGTKETKLLKNVHTGKEEHEAKERI